MPKIPTVQADEQLHTASVDSNVSASAFGQKTGAALEQLGETISDGFYKLNDINNEVNAHKAITGAQTELSDYQQELKTGPTNDGSQTDSNGIPYPVGSLQIDPASGLPVGPPPPEQHAQLMQDKIDELKEKYGNSFGAMGGGAQRMFNANFDQHASAQLLETKAHAITRMNQSLDENLKTDLATRANLAVNADPLVRHTTEHETETYIDKMVTSGVLTPEQGAQRKEMFIHQVELGSIRNIMKSPLRDDGTDGATDLVKAIDNGEFNKLPADVLQRQREMALDQHTHNQNQKEAAERRADASLEKQRRESDRTNALRLSVAFTNGTLEPAQVAGLAQKGQISPETALAYGKLAAGGDNIPSDRNTKGDLLNRAFNGDADVVDRLNDAFKHRKINSADYDLIRTKAVEFQDSMKGNPGAKQAFDYVHGKMGGDATTKLPAQNAAEAEVKQGLHDYLRQNPKATADQLHEQADQLVRRASIFDKDSMVTSMLSPRFFPGTKADLMAGDQNAQREGMKAAYEKTLAAQKAKQISDAEANKEFASISRWAKALDLNSAPPAKVKK